MNPSTNQPLVTVVVPTYNRAALALETIASIRAQTFSDWELIVADDGSEDDTVLRVHSLGDNRIKVLMLTHCGNIAEVRNAGAKAGSGKWISFLDSDDMWLPEKLELQLNLLWQSGKRWSYGGFEFMNENGEAIPGRSAEYHPLSGWIIRELITNKASVDPGALLMERTLFDELGGFNTDPRLFCREDYEFTLRLALKAEGIAFPGVLYRIRKHSGRTTQMLANSYEYSAFVYEHFINSCNEPELIRLARHERAHELAEASVKNMELGNRRRAIKQLMEAARSGDSARHLLSSVQHCVFKRKSVEIEKVRKVGKSVSREVRGRFMDDGS